MVLATVMTDVVAQALDKVAGLRADGGPAAWSIERAALILPASTLSCLLRLTSTCERPKQLQEFDHPHLPPMVRLGIAASLRYGEYVDST